MHNLFGERFYGRRVPAWHRLGKVFDGPMTVTQAVADADLDYLIHLLPAYVSAGGGFQELPGRIIMREPTLDDPVWRQLGPNLVSQQYALLQNIELARIFDPLTDTWPLETIGALGYGETLFFTLRAGKFSVGGDEIENYFLVSDVRDGGTTAKVAITPKRVVCQNTLQSGLRTAVVTVDLAHQKGLEARLENIAELVKRLHGSTEQLKEAFDRLAVMKVDDAGKREIFTAAYPMPRRPKKLEYLTDEMDEVTALYNERTQAEEMFEYHGRRAVELRNAANDLFARFNEEFPRTAGTAWAAWNSIVELEDFRGSGRDEGAARSAVFGPRAAAKRRAFQAAMALV